MKDFNKWNNIKKQIDISNNNPIFYEREIWYCRIGLNIGFEQNGVGERFIRPVLIFKKFNKNILWCFPLTKTQKNMDFYFLFQTRNFTSTAILSQLKLIDSKRLLHKIDYIDKNQFENLKIKFRGLLP